jgi:acetolactate synthase-1/2/3 large subunit
MKVHRAIAAELAHLGVRHVFGLMGDGNLKLIPALHHDFDVAFYATRHEAAAVAMADGYARSSGEVGVCTFTQGPGLTNAITALVTAHRGRVPMLALAGDTPTSVRGLPQDIDQAPLIEAAGLAVAELRPETAHADVAAAWRRAVDERRPVVLCLPTDMQEEEAGDEISDLPTTSRTQVVPGDVAAAIEAIDRSERPVIVAGRGALEADARDGLLELGERIGALLATSLPANGWFSAEQWNVGIAGGFASEATRELLGEADCIIAAGASLNHFTTRGGSLFSADATIIQVDERVEAFGKYTRRDVDVLGDVRLVAGVLAAGSSPRTRFRTASTAARIAAAAAPVADASDPRGLDPRVVASGLADMLPPGAVLAVDGGHFMGFPSMGISVDGPQDYIFTLDFGSIGLGLGAALGAAVARPDRLVVGAVGDGGLMMSLAELDTAARLGIPVLIVVFNDASYGAELHFLRMCGLPEDACRFDTTAPLAPVAQALGVEALRVETADDLAAVRARLNVGLDAPLLLDCQVTDQVVATWLEEAFDRGTH